MADIGKEARNLSLVSSDSDNFRNSYKTTELQSDGSSVGIVFSAPSFAVLDKYRFYILQNCKKTRLDSKYKYRPDYLSYDEYGTTNWWYLILYINDIPTLQEFDQENILLPNLDCISKLSEEATRLKSLKTINQDDLNNNQPAILYHSPTYKISEQLRETVRELTNVDSIADRMKREEFVLDITTLRTRHIDLEFPAIENSINLVVRGKPNYIYGKHYILTESTPNMKNRITWDPNIVKGSGLVFRLKEKDIIQVTYVSK